MKKILLFLLLIILFIKDSLEQNILKCPRGYIRQCKKEDAPTLSKDVQRCICVKLHK
jgi:hypothetical protein